MNLNAKELALVAVLASLWMVAQISLGPIVGSFSLGPITMHGVINHIVGWFLMVMMAKISDRFGRVSLMALTAALGTRVIRVETIEGVLVGLGYAVAGLLFDVLYFTPVTKRLEEQGKRAHTLWISLISVVTAAVTMVPFLLFRFFITGYAAFIVLLPSYLFSMARNIFFSLLGATLALSIFPRIKRFMAPR